MCRIGHGEEVGGCLLLLTRDVSTPASHLGKLRPQVTYMGHKGRERDLERWVGGMNPRSQPQAEKFALPSGLTGALEG